MANVVLLSYQNRIPYFPPCIPVLGITVVRHIWYILQWNIIFLHYTGKDLTDMSLDELNENEDDIDEEDERMFEEYRYGRTKTAHVESFVLSLEQSCWDAYWS